MKDEKQAFEEQLDMMALGLDENRNKRFQEELVNKARLRRRSTFIGTAIAFLIMVVTFFFIFTYAKQNYTDESDIHLNHIRNEIQVGVQGFNHVNGRLPVTTTGELDLKLLKETNYISLDISKYKGKFGLNNGAVYIIKR